MPKVSFILTAYKRRFLKEAIDSILAQTCRDFELVIVDDKSPENLYEIIREYLWEPSFKPMQDGGRSWLVDGIPVRYYQNAENIGGKDLVAAWNHAMKYASSEWCVMASDDDVYDSGYLWEMLRLQAKYPKCDLFHARIAVIDEQGKYKRIGPQWSEFIGQIPFVYDKEVLRKDSFAADFMFRRSALDKLGGFIHFPLAIYSDDATWMTLAGHGVGCSSTILFKWRASGQNISTRTDNALGKLRACEYFRGWFRSFTSALSPVTDEEVFLSARLIKGAETQINNLARNVMRNIKSLPAWFNVFHRASPQPHLKWAFIYDRFPIIRAIWKLSTHMSVGKRIE